MLTSPISPGFSNFQVKGLSPCTKFGGGGPYQEQKHLCFLLESLLMYHKPLLVNLDRFTGTMLCFQQERMPEVESLELYILG